MSTQEMDLCLRCRVRPAVDHLAGDPQKWLCKECQAEKPFTQEEANRIEAYNKEVEECDGRDPERCVLREHRHGQPQ